MTISRPVCQLRLEGESLNVQNEEQHDSFSILSQQQMVILLQKFVTQVKNSHQLKLSNGTEPRLLEHNGKELYSVHISAPSVAGYVATVADDYASVLIELSGGAR